MTKLIKPDSNSVSQFEPFYHVPKEEFERMQSDKQKLVEALESVDYSVRECKTDSGSVILGDELESKIQQTLNEVRDES